MQVLMNWLDLRLIFAQQLTFFHTELQKIIWQNNHHGRESVIINVNSSLSEITGFAKGMHLWALTQECKVHVHSEHTQDGMRGAAVHRS